MLLILVKCGDAATDASLGIGMSVSEEPLGARLSLDAGPRPPLEAPVGVCFSCSSFSNFSRLFLTISA